MAFAAARMILKDKRRKTSKEDFAPRNKSKLSSRSGFSILAQVSFILGEIIAFINFDKPLRSLQLFQSL
ncbi:hypothetical protein TcasGA2_TC006654 [Tribolium castaneum]|uniref:Uncharacterized protein n=1 Tax=Tribolium castaneum TaxID=7070 RepID=D6WY46_TRICA|nr:hypothetical protein TcasGA2_TC006654 [Tribolium castaneum]